VQVLQAGYMTIWRAPFPAQGFSYDLKVPLPRTLSAIGTKHKTILKHGLRI
jgi:hypothetical protein